MNVFNAPVKLRSILLLAFFVSKSAVAGVTGGLDGHVKDAVSGGALRGAEISILELGKQSVTDKDGFYVFTALPPGKYTLLVNFVGYAMVTPVNVTIKTDATAHIDINMALRAILADTSIVIERSRTPLPYEIPSTTHYVNDSDFSLSLPVDNYIESFKLMPGIFSNHFRGGRLGDVIYLIDGVPMISAMSRNVAFNLPTSAVEEIVVQTGGFSAEYGNGNAGVVNIIRKRARDKFQFNARSYSDNVGKLNEEFDNLRSVEAGFGGPMAISFGGPVLDANYYISGNYTTTDTPFREQFKSQFNDPIQRNGNLSAIVDLKLTQDLHLSLQSAVSQWRWRTLDDLGNDPISALPLHANNRLNTAVHLTHTLSPSMYYRLSLGYNKIRDRVSGSVIDTLQSVILSNNLSPTLELGLDESPWRQSVQEDIYYLRANFLKQLSSKIQVRAGLSSEYYDVAMDGQKLVVQPYRLSEPKVAYSYNKFVNEFQESPYTIAGYVESRVRLPLQMIAQVGLRMDYFHPNARSPQNADTTLHDPAAILASPKIVPSPRIGVSVPITAVDYFYANYGVYAQIPSLYHLYAGTGTASDVFIPLQGNPDLHLEQSRNLEFSYHRSLPNASSFHATAFYREYHNLVDSEILASSNSALALEDQIRYTQGRFSNSAFGRARGVELLFNYNLVNGLNSRFGYTYMLSTGTANNPEEYYNLFVRNGNASSKFEDNLKWDQRHSYLIAVKLDTRDMEIGFISRLFSSREWLDESTTGTLQKKLPVRNLLDFKFAYKGRIGKHKLLPFFEIRNFFDVRFEEIRENSLFFNDQPLVFSQDYLGRRYRIGFQIN